MNRYKVKTVINEIKKTMIMLLIMFLLGGFALVGSTDSTALNNDRTNADNDAQQRISPTDMHTSRWSVRKPNKNEKKKNLWRKAKCSRSADLRDFRSATQKSQRKGPPGTDQQRTAWKQLGVQAPFFVAKDIANTIYHQCYKGQDSIQQVLNEEIEGVLKFNKLKRFDTSIRVDYLLHVLMNLGSAMPGIFKKLKGSDKKAAKASLTISVKHIVTALNQQKDLIADSGYKLSVKPHKYKGKKAVTFALWGLMYQNGNPPFKQYVFQEVANNFDSETYDSILEAHTAEALQAEASVKLKEWNNLYAKNPKGFFEVVPQENLSNIVRQFRDKGTTMTALKEAGADTTNIAGELKELQRDFIGAYASEMQKTMPNRETLLAEKQEAVYAKRLKEIKTEKHSWDIQISRTTKKDKIEVTMLWHLSHMSDWKVKGSEVVANDHAGARYLLGPSNGVRSPDQINNGFVNGLDNIKAGYSTKLYTGDTVSLQMIQNSKNPNLFSKPKTESNKDVRSLMHRRTRLWQLYTMINVGLGRDPNQAPHRVMGLYTNPQFVKDPANFRAETISAFKIASTKPTSKPNKPKKKKGKSVGPNTRKNRRNAPTENPVDENEASPEEVEAYLKNQATNVKTKEAHMAEMPNYEGMKKSDLADECVFNGLKKSGNKADLVARLKEHYENSFTSPNSMLGLSTNSIGDAKKLLTDGVDSIGGAFDLKEKKATPRKSKKKKGNTPPASARRKKASDKEDN